MPGTIIGAYIVDYLGPKNTMVCPSLPIVSCYHILKNASQVLGLVSQAVVGFIMSGLYNLLVSHIAAFAVVYGLFLSLGEVGPGNCLGMLAAKTGPTAVRGQFYGLAAAIGKVGAFVGTWGTSSHGCKL